MTRGYGIAAEDTTHAMDVLTKAFTTSNTNLVELGNAFKMVGPVAKTAGLGFEQTTAALQIMADAGIVDPKRACIVGASYGGYAAMAGITLQKDVYRCAVAVAGVSDLKRMVSREYNEGRSQSLRDFREETMGPRSEMDSISPAKLADQASAPILSGRNPAQ